MPLSYLFCLVVERPRDALKSGLSDSELAVTSKTISQCFCYADEIFFPFLPRHFTRCSPLSSSPRIAQCFRRTHTLGAYLNSTNKRILIRNNHEFCPSNRCARYVFSNFSSAAPQLISNFWNLVALGALIVFSIIEMSIAAWITAKYNAHHNYPTSGTRARVRYILFVSVWTIAIGSLYLIGFLVAPTSIFSSMASYSFLYVLSYSAYHLIPCFLCLNRFFSQPNSHFNCHL